MAIRKIIRFPTVRDITGMSRSTVDRLEKAGDFPERVRLSHVSVGWVLSEVQRWVETRPRGGVDPELVKAANEACAKARAKAHAEEQAKRSTRSRKQHPSTAA